MSAAYTHAVQSVEQIGSIQISKAEPHKENCKHHMPRAADIITLRLLLLLKDRVSQLDKHGNGYTPSFLG